MKDIIFENIVSFFFVVLPLSGIVFGALVVFPFAIYYEGKQICKDGVVYTKNFTQGTFVEDPEYKDMKCTEKVFIK
jgi:hypothetical protein